MKYSEHVNVRATHPRERTPGREEIQNNAGGFVHEANEWDRLDRFLILGSEGNTYYVGERKLTVENAEHIIALIKDDGLRVINRLVAISKSGRAHKNSAALFVLAAAMKLGDMQTRRYAAGVMPEVVRTGAHLFEFAEYVEAFGGWGRATRRAFSRWYNEKAPDKLAYQLLKYRQRGGWGHRDILRLAHPKTSDAQMAAIFEVTTRPAGIEKGLMGLPKLYAGFEKAQALSGNPDPALIEQYGLSWEMLPTEWLNDLAVNTQLLKTMPLMATIRQLGRLSSNGTIKPLSDEAEMVAKRLTDDEQIRKSRIHPMHYLLALRTYGAGAGARGNLRWVPDPRILDALDEGFEKAFVNVEPTGKRFFIGLDVSGSMSSTMGNLQMSCREAGAAMTVVLARSEEKVFTHGFSDTFVKLPITAKTTVADAVLMTSRLPFARTDCALPMQYALKEQIDVDTFVVITDNETWCGNMKPVDALREYRRKLNPEAKLIVVAMVANRFSIADPGDAGMLDVVGFDAGVMPLIAEFSK